MREGITTLQRANKAATKRRERKERLLQRLDILIVADREAMVAQREAA
jgi:hypothetical protein